MKNGFTLIELLVVIAIISLLAGIIFPVFAQAKEKAKTATCLSNTKQVGTAILLYMQDYDEKYPTIDSYPNGNHGGATYAKDIFLYTQIISPYVKSYQLKCPHIPVYQNVDPKFTTGYMINDRLGSVLLTGGDPDRIEDVGRSMSEVYNPPVSVMLTECKTGRLVLNYPDNPSYASTDASATPFYVKELYLGVARNEWDGSVRHSGGSNYVFCDGHAKWYKPDIFFDPNDANGKQPTFRVLEKAFIQ
jgi:prepilin-type N-terminal cleavage/methylation domain-containing protein/prepilin-type processing-associated H-X9-DG protein